MTSGEEKSKEIVQATITVHGQVQQLGYREMVNHLAKGLGLRGFVENLKDSKAKDAKRQPVGIVCQGRRSVIETFVNLIKIRNGHIDVERVEVTYLDDADVTYQGFYVLRGEFLEELGPRLDTAIGVLKSMDGKLKSMGGQLNSVDGDLKSIDGELKSMGGQLNSVDGELKGMGGQLENIDGQLRRGHDELKEELGGIRSELKKVAGDTEVGIELTREGVEQTRQGFEQTHQDFQGLDGKYHTVTEELKKIRQALEKGLDVKVEEKKRRYVVKKAGEGDE